jgi:hypothetical protein
MMWFVLLDLDFKSNFEMFSVVDTELHPYFNLLFGVYRIFFKLRNLFIYLFQIALIELFNFPFLEMTCRVLIIHFINDIYFGQHHRFLLFNPAYLNILNYFLIFDLSHLVILFKNLMAAYFVNLIFFILMVLIFQFG